MKHIRKYNENNSFSFSDEKDKVIDMITMEITDGNGNILFYGKVKNYNELKNLMKWIFI